MKIKVCYWDYSDGYGRHNIDPLFFCEEDKGWSCWVYTDDNYEFLDWMSSNMKYEYSAVPRYNSGDPMLTVKITNAEDASLFKLMFV
jgi:hypothetical protein